MSPEPKVFAGSGKRTSANAERRQKEERNIFPHFTTASLSGTVYRCIVRRCAETGCAGGRVSDSLHLAAARKAIASSSTPSIFAIFANSLLNEPTAFVRRRIRLDAQVAETFAELHRVRHNVSPCPVTIGPVTIGAS